MTTWAEPGSKLAIPERHVTSRATLTSTRLSRRRIGRGSSSIYSEVGFYRSNAYVYFSFAPAEEIGQYFISVAKKYSLYDLITFSSCLKAAKWNESTAQWVVQVASLLSSETVEYRADILINAGGILNDWKWPDVPGLETFKGKRVHTAAWVSIFPIQALHVGLGLHDYRTHLLM